MTARLRVYGTLRKRSFAERLAPAAFWAFYALLPALFVAVCIWAIGLKREAMYTEKLISGITDDLLECQARLGEKAP